MFKKLLILLAALPAVCYGQVAVSPSPYINGLLRKPTAAEARSYLGVGEGGAAGVAAVSGSALDLSVTNLTSHNTVLTGSLTGSAVTNLANLIGLNTTNMTASVSNALFLLIQSRQDGSSKLSNIVAGIAVDLYVGALIFPTPNGTSQFMYWAADTEGELTLHADFVGNGTIIVKDVRANYVYANGVTVEGDISGDGVNATSYLTVAGQVYTSMVKSVGVTTDAAYLTVGSSPVTGTGTITINSTTGLAANQVLATPDATTGVVSRRALVERDLPEISMITAIATTGSVTNYSLDFTNKVYDLGMTNNLKWTASLNPPATGKYRETVVYMQGNGSGYRMYFPTTWKPAGGTWATNGVGAVGIAMTNCTWIIAFSARGPLDTNIVYAVQAVASN